MVLFIHLKIILLHFFFQFLAIIDIQTDSKRKKKKASLNFFYESHALFIGPVNTDFNKFFFKTGSHDTIHIFKNYFSLVFLIFNFQQ